MTNQYSIKDLAAYCGVSLATISRVLNQKGGYSKATEEKVLRAVEETGFTLNMAAKTLKEAKSNSIGLILPNITNNYFAKLAYEIETFFYEKGYALYICDTANDAERERSYFKSLAGKQVAGIITISGLNELTDDFLIGNIPVVCLDRKPETGKPIPTVSNDNTEACFKATEHLIQKGCRNMLFFTSYTAAYKKSERLDGYRKALAKNGIPFRGEYVLERAGKAPAQIESEKLMCDFLKTGNPVDGVVTTSERTALGCMQAIKKAGLNVPGDIRVITFDNTILSSMSAPALTSVERGVPELAQAACSALLNLIQGNPVAYTTVVPCSIVERESTE